MKKRHPTLVSAASLLLHSLSSDLRSVRASWELGPHCVRWGGALCTAGHKVGTEFCTDPQVLPGSILPWLFTEILLSFCVSCHLSHFSPPPLCPSNGSLESEQGGRREKWQWYTRETIGRDFQRTLRKD